MKDGQTNANRGHLSTAGLDWHEGMGFRRGMRTVVLCGLMLLADLASASQVAPTRPLRAGEELALRVADARRIVVGQIVSRYDTLYNVSVSHPGFLRHAGIVTLQPTRVLRGGTARAPLRFIEWSSRRGFSTDDKAGDRGSTISFHPPSEPLIVFLEDLDERPRTTEDRGISRWASKPIQMPNWTPEFEKEVRAEVVRQSPERLISSAERIVLAHPADSRFIGKVWIVDRTLRGVPADTVEVREVLPSASSGSRRALLFLHRVDNVLEPVRLGGGIVNVREKRVPAWNCSLDEAIRRITGAKP